MQDRSFLESAVHPLTEISALLRRIGVSTIRWLARLNQPSLPSLDGWQRPRQNTQTEVSAAHPQKKT